MSSSENPPVEVLRWKQEELEKAHLRLVTQLKDFAERQETKMDSFALKLDAAMTHMRSHACPTPGACVNLMRDMSEVTSDIKRLDEIVKKFEEDRDKRAERHETERVEVLDNLNTIKTDIAVARGGLRVTLFWVGVIGPFIGAVTTLVAPAFIKMLSGQ